VVRKTSAQPTKSDLNLTHGQSTVIAQIARHEGITGIIGQVLNIPVTCHPDHFPVSKYEYNSYVQNADAPVVSSARMRFFWGNYLPRAEPDPRASPLLAPYLANLPPTRSSSPSSPHRNHIV
jgi:acetyl esterase/lipase